MTTVAVKKKLNENIQAHISYFQEYETTKPEVKRMQSPWSSVSELNILVSKNYAVAFPLSFLKQTLEAERHR